MSELLVPSILAFMPALAVAILLTPIVRRIAVRLNIVDKPTPRKLHVTPKPLLGGLAIYFAVVLGLLLTVPSNYRPQLIALVVGASFLSAVGLVDDRISLHAKVKLFAAIPLAGFILVLGGIRITAWPLSPFLRGYPDFAFYCSVALTVLWVVIVTSAFAILDHMDGLCAGVSAIAAAFFLLFALREGQPLMAIMAAALLGATLGFLGWNFKPASIFMGDSGALLIGFLISALGILLKFSDLTTYTSWMIPPLVLGIPLFDAALVVVSRYRRGLIPSMSPGKDHLAHRLGAMGLGERGAVLVVYAITTLFGLFALLFTRLGIGFAYSLAVFLLACLFIALWKLEEAPYERQEYDSGAR